MGEHGDYLERVFVKRPFRNRPHISAMYFDFSDMLHSGVDLPCCDHQGKRGERLHGTKDLWGILASDGVLKPARPWRRANNCDGWYHVPLRDMDRALMYAGHHQIGQCKYRVIVHVDCRCFNRVKGRKWHYTRRGCLRYEVIGAYFVPSASCEFMEVNGD